MTQSGAAASTARFKDFGSMFKQNMEKKSASAAEGVGASASAAAATAAAATAAAAASSLASLSGRPPLASIVSHKPIKATSKKPAAASDGAIVIVDDGDEAVVAVVDDDKKKKETEKEKAESVIVIDDNDDTDVTSKAYLERVLRDLKLGQERHKQAVADLEKVKPVSLHVLFVCDFCVCSLCVCVCVGTSMCMECVCM